MFFFFKKKKKNHTHQADRASLVQASALLASGLEQVLEISLLLFEILLLLLLFVFVRPI
jgi:hypothetical protein